MDRLKITITKKEYEGTKLMIVNFFINGKDFIEIIKDTELPYARKDGTPDIAGEYIGLSADAILSSHGHLMGKPRPTYLENGKTHLLTCRGCMEPGCWPLLAKIEVSKDKVTWKDFEQPHRHGQWNYDKVGPYEFDRTQYEHELAKLNKVMV